MKKLISSIALAFIGTLVINAVSAQTTFDPSTGTGFAAKGDVQTAFGWNNAKLQARAADVTFTYITTATYDAVCTWTTGEGTNGEDIHHVTHKTTTGVNDVVTYDARKNHQGDITGFTLTGFGSSTGSGDDVPVVGGPCPGYQGTGGTWTSVTQTSSGGGLYVNYNGTAVLIWPPVL